MSDKSTSKEKKKSANHQAVEAMLQTGESMVTMMPAYIKNGSHVVNGMLALTNQRLLFHGNYAFAKHTRSLELSQITTMNVNGSRLGAHMIVTLAGATEQFSGHNATAQKFVADVNAQISTIRQRDNAPAAPSAADELAKFAALHAQGILTDDEWAAKKAQLL